jgi:hypothetical protein
MISSIQSKLQVKEKVYNEILDRVCRNEIDIAFFEAKANNYKKKSPEHKQNLQQAEEVRTNMFWNKMLLKVVKKQIDELEADQNADIEL